jgi:hypothetical protein
MVGADAGLCRIHAARQKTAKLLKVLGERYRRLNDACACRTQTCAPARRIVGMWIWSSL